MLKSKTVIVAEEGYSAESQPSTPTLATKRKSSSSSSTLKKRECAETPKKPRSDDSNVMNKLDVVERSLKLARNSGGANSRQSISDKPQQLIVKENFKKLDVVESQLIDDQEEIHISGNDLTNNLKQSGSNTLISPTASSKKAKEKTIRDITNDSVEDLSSYRTSNEKPPYSISALVKYYFVENKVATATLTEIQEYFKEFGFYRIKTDDKWKVGFLKLIFLYIIIVLSFRSI